MTPQNFRYKIGFDNCLGMDGAKDFNWLLGGLECVARDIMICPVGVAKFSHFFPSG